MSEAGRSEPTLQASSSMKASVDKPVSNMEEALQYLDNDLRNLDVKIKILLEKLGPVLCPPVPTDSSEKQLVPTEVSPFTHILRELDLRILEMAGVVDSITARLEV